MVPCGLCEPGTLWLAFFGTVTNTDIAFYVFFLKAFLTMSYAFVRFCVFPFIFYLFITAWEKQTPLYLPCSIDNCLKNAENLYVSLLLYIRKFLRQSRAYFSISEYNPVLWNNIFWGKGHYNKLCLYMVFFTVWSYWTNGTVHVTFFHGTRAGLNLLLISPTSF